MPESAFRRTFAGMLGEMPRKHLPLPNSRVVGTGGTPLKVKHPAEPEGRKKSKLTQVGDEAKVRAMRALLLETLVLHRWNLTATAEALEMGQPSAVLRAIRDVGLEPHYEVARRDGLVSPGNRTE